MKWTEKFPMPEGPAPEEPRTEPQDGNPFLPSEKARAYNAWVGKVRKHQLALAVEKLTARAEGTPEQNVAVIVAIMILEGSIREVDPNNIFALWPF